jgi:hypothetical protein
VLVLAGLACTLEAAQRCGLAPNQLVLDLRREASMADPSASRPAVTWASTSSPKGLKATPKTAFEGLRPLESPG